MTRCHSYQEIMAIEAEAWRAFDCQPVASGRGGKNRDAKREKVTRITNKFFDAMLSDNPPKTEQEAVEMLTPLMGMILSMFFKQLAVMVVEWLWARTQREQEAGA